MTDLETAVHRIKLGMGIKGSFRSQGLGARLLTTALEWLRSQNKIEWVDLTVFSENIAARKLYKKFGFKETVVIKDAFRVDGQSIDDIQMVLSLKKL